MDKINKTLYIPLYGKSFVSQKGIILRDEKAEMIWEKEKISLKGKSKSKWLAYYMSMRARVFDEWLLEQMALDKNAIVLHIGCGMDNRIGRVGIEGCLWYDVDFEEVIQARQKYYAETSNYKMISGDFCKEDWLQAIVKAEKAIVILEGVSMYVQLGDLKNALARLGEYFPRVKILMDCYTQFAAKMSKYKNPINDVGVTTVYGLKEPCLLEGERLKFLRELEMTPLQYVQELAGMERFIFQKLFAGKLSKKIYRLYEFEIKTAV